MPPFSGRKHFFLWPPVADLRRRSFLIGIGFQNLLACISVVFRRLPWEDFVCSSPLGFYSIWSSIRDPGSRVWLPALINLFSRDLFEGRDQRVGPPGPFRPARSRPPVVRLSVHIRAEGDLATSPSSLRIPGIPGADFNPRIPSSPSLLLGYLNLFPCPLFAFTARCSLSYYFFFPSPLLFSIDK